MERERAEAYKIYVSDSLALFMQVLAKEEVEVPRYVDMLKKKEKKPEESAEQIISRFDRLRRKKE